MFSLASGSRDSQCAKRKGSLRTTGTCDSSVHWIRAKRGQWAYAPLSRGTKHTNPTIFLHTHIYTHSILVHVLSLICRIKNDRSNIYTKYSLIILSYFYRKALMYIKAIIFAWKNLYTLLFLHVTLPRISPFISIFYILFFINSQLKQRLNKKKEKKNEYT